MFAYRESIQIQSYETFKITNTSVASIDMKEGAAGTDIKIKLSSPAWVGRALINAQGELEATFTIKNEDAKRFKNALSVRGLVRATLPMS